MNLLTLCVLLMSAQDPLPAAGDIIRNIEEKNRALQPFHAELVWKWDGSFWSRHGDVSTLAVSPDRWLALENAEVGPYGEVFYRSTLHTEETSATRHVTLAPHEKRATAVAFRFRPDDATAEQLLAVNLLPRAFLRDDFTVTRDTDPKRYILTRPSDGLAYTVDARDWRIHAVSIESNGKRDEETATSFSEISGVMLPVKFDYQSLEILHAQAGPAERPTWAALDELPPEPADVETAAETLVPEDADFKALFGRAVAIALSKGPFASRPSQELHDALLRAHARRGDCEVLNDMLTLLRYSMGDEAALRETPTPLSSYAAAMLDEESGQLDAAEKRLAGISGQGVLAILREYMQARLAIRKTSDPAEMLKRIVDHLRSIPVDILEPPLLIDMRDTRSIGAFADASDDACDQIAARAEDPRIHLMLARRWLKKGDFARAEKAYLRLPGLFRFYDHEINGAVQRAKGRMPKLIRALLDAGSADLATVLLALPDLDDPQRANIVQNLHTFLQGHPSTLQPREAVALYSAIVTLTERGADLVDLLRVALPRHPSNVVQEGQNPDKELARALDAVARKNASLRHELLLLIPKLDYIHLMVMGIDMKAFMADMRARAAKPDAPRTVFRIIARHIDYEHSYGKPDREDISLLECGIESYPDLVEALMALADVAYLNDHAYARAAELYERAILARIIHESRTFWYANCFKRPSVHDFRHFDRRALWGDRND
ncbi:MAG: hypothetical protein HYY16_04145, partial [Planctomycetes bacterium]|nr:hypothetical protein [Planctomycetota bacterium]